MSLIKVKVKRSEVFCPRALFEGNEDWWYKLNAGKTIVMTKKESEKFGNKIVVVEEIKSMDTTVKSESQKGSPFKSRKGKLEESDSSGDTER